MERRECPRLNLRLNVEFLREGEERRACRAGTTTDVSAGGAFFRTNEWDGVTVGEEVALRLSGLSGYGTGPLFRSLRARAKVLRMEVAEEASHRFEQAGIAVSFLEKPSFEIYRWTE